MIPRATMRLQLHKGFRFADAEKLVPYFDHLGISHLYASPITTARPGSMHGYDVITPLRVNPELGGEDALISLAVTPRTPMPGMVPTRRLPIAATIALGAGLLESTGRRRLSFT